MNETFKQQVFEIIKMIPKGRVTTYGAIASYLGTGKSARMVGWAMNSSHYVVPYVPAHRVVNRNGLLTGKHHFDTPTMMKELLENEGIKVMNDAVQNFDKLFWDPGKELE